ncbi:response regulator [Pseudomonas sp. zfem001]|uniref:response regulator n=1 Tax=Pseudomonas sp. zfem001 TaxID=3078196 RepID=UPI00292793BC|nr:response regulator [Pseudomonas sp. zfem001]MDU9409962.1 response regulator [Pseudomonas sp. zfem001]
MSVQDSTLLVVDSDPALTRALVEELQRQGFSQVLQANDVNAAVQLLQHKPISLVLSEQNLNGSTGLTLFERMRSDERLAEIPFVLMSSAMQRQDVQRAIQLGIRDLLVKPFTTQRLLERIQRSLQSDDLPARSSPQAEGEERASILVVDDTPENLQLLAGLFRDQFKVKLAHNGEKAISICHSDNPPDLILLDVMMPDMDGFEVARRLRQHHASEHIPIIFVTALNDERSREHGLSHGAVDYVFKPIDPALLRIRVRNLMRHVEHRRQLQADLDQLLELAALRADMLHLVKHELQQPLNESGEVLRALARSGLTPVQVQEVQRAAQSMQQMKELLDIASEQLSLGAGQRELQPESIRLNPLLRELIAELRQRYGDQGVDIQLETALGSSATVLADSGLCHALFYRVLRHAHQACPMGSQLSLVMIDESPVQVKLVLPSRPQSSKPLAAARAMAHALGGDIQHGDEGGSYSIRVNLPRA